MHAREYASLPPIPPQCAPQARARLPESGRLFLVETRDIVWWGRRKLDAIYKHVEFEKGRARYREVHADRYLLPEHVLVFPLACGVIEEAV